VLAHQLGVDADSSDVVDVARGHRRAMDLGFEHVALHQFSFPPITTLSISLVFPTRAATAIRTGRPLNPGAGARSPASRASRYSGSTPADSSSAPALAI